VKLNEYLRAASARGITNAALSSMDRRKQLRHFRRNLRLGPLAAEAVELRARIVRGEASTANLIEWLLQSADHVQVWLELTAFDDEVARTLRRLKLAMRRRTLTMQKAELTTSGTEPELSGASNNLNEDGHLGSVKNTPAVKWLAFAASLIIALALTLLAQHSMQSEQSEQIVTTGAGQWHRMTLSDGTTVHVDARSRVEVAYTDEERIVHIEQGSAVFDVTKDSARPFIARTHLVDAIALGTRFGVSVDPGVTTTVSEGIVKVTGRGQTGRTAVILKAGEELRVPNDTRTSSQVARVDAERKLQWAKNGLLILDGMTISEGVDQLNRRNRTQIVVESPTLGAKVIELANVKANSPEAYARIIAATPGVTMILDEENDVIRLSE
jgi:ferric-dicitrate binding protein FerR (iron transport regulator)